MSQRIAWVVEHLTRPFHLDVHVGYNARQANCPPTNLWRAAAVCRIRIRALFVCVDPFRETNPLDERFVERFRVPAESHKVFCANYLTPRNYLRDHHEERARLGRALATRE